MTSEAACGLCGQPVSAGVGRSKHLRAARLEYAARHRQAGPLYGDFNRPIFIKIDRMLTTFDRREPPLK